MKNKPNHDILWKQNVKKILLTMKISFLLLVLTVLNAYATNIFSQNMTVSVDMKNATVREVVSEIGKQGGINFLFNDNLAGLNQRVSVSFADQPIRDVLENTLSQADMTYEEIKDDFVVLLSKPDYLKQQEITVTGRVTDAETGEPLPGASILVSGTTIGTVTFEDGSYSISIPDRDVTLVFTFVGYEKQEILVGEQNVINVSLKEDIAMLDEVVAIGYGTLRRLEITGSIATVDSEELANIPAANTTELLAGRLSGVITQQTSGLPGSDDTEINIRGYGSPLVIVDGIQMDFSRIDPNDIESVTVLKDAAAAVYGARAGNGVILVNTKRGKTDKPTIQYHGTYTTQEAMAFMNRVNAGDWASLFREAQLNLGLPPELSEEEVQNYVNGVPGYESYDWTGELIENFAPMQQHNISVNGGNDRVKYYASVGFTDQESVFRSREFDYTRHNARTNLDLAITDKLNFAIDISYQKDFIDRPTQGLDGIWTSLSTAQPRYPTWLPDRSVGSYSGFQTRNPLVQTMKEFTGFYNRHDETFTGKIEGRYELPINGLRLNAGANVMTVNTYTKNFNTPYDLYIYVPEDDEYIWQAGGTRMDLRERHARGSQIYPFSSLTYDQTFNNHSVKGLLLGEYIEDYSNYFNAFRRDLLSREIPYLFTGGDQNIDNTGSASEGGRASVVGRINYNYNAKYFLEATFRYDANVQFAPEHRWGFFPSISTAWRISEEPFFGDGNFVNDLKIRASYTELGNDRFAEGWDYLTGFQILNVRGHLVGNEIRRQIRTLGLANPLLTWEGMTIYNLGLNAAFLDNRIVIETDVFYRKREGILAREQRTLPSTFGAALPLTNLNSQDTRGLEAMVIYQDNIGSFNFSVSPNFTYARSKWIHFEETEYTDPDDIRIFQESGNWVNRTIGYLSDGIFMSQSEIDNHPIDQDQNGNTTLIPGDIKYIDLNGDGVIDYRDQKEIGYGTFPNLTYGLALNASYKSFRLDALFQGASLFNSRITGEARGMFANGTIPLDYQKEYRWQPDPNDPTVNINPDAALPAASIDIRPNNDILSDFWLKDATYIRLKSLSLSYNLPETAIRNAGFGMVQIYLSGTNLFTFSKLGIYKNSFDPEQPGSIRNYPLHRRYSLGLRITI
jgi:TonB-linked SusC/RagA family outer membrane protein